MKKIYVTIMAFILLIAPAFAELSITYPIGARNPHAVPMRSIAPMREYKINPTTSNQNDEYSEDYKVVGKYTGRITTHRITNIGGGLRPGLADEELNYLNPNNEESANYSIGTGRPGGPGVPTPLEMSWDVVVFILILGLISAYRHYKKRQKTCVNNN
jgi:hypothetical protein